MNDAVHAVRALVQNEDVASKPKSRTVQFFEVRRPLEFTLASVFGLMSGCYFSYIVGSPLGVYIPHANSDAETLNALKFLAGELTAVFGAPLWAGFMIYLCRYRLVFYPLVAVTGLPVLYKLVLYILH